jgi:nucleotide-binding universal stress UspA family protein
MPVYRHVACCIDTGETARATLAGTVALWHDAPPRISALFVAPPEQVMRGGLTEWEIDDSDPFAPPRRWLEELAAVHGVEPVLLSGEPPQQVVSEWLGESDADLVVAAAHNRPLVRALIGSFATDLAYHAPVDTLILPPDDQRPDQRLREIVCALDGGPDGEQALRATRHIADSTGARTTLVHAVAPPVPLGKNLVAEALPMPEGREREAEAILHDAASSVPGSLTRVLAGAPVDAVTRYAEQAGADLIVVGPRSGGRPGLGGFASKLIRSAPCAVLLARAPRAAD